MGRAIKPQAIRRLHDGSPVEILSTSGFWVRYDLASPATIANCKPWIDAYGINGWDFPEGAFAWGVIPAADPADDPDLEEAWAEVVDDVDAGDGDPLANDQGEGDGDNQDQGNQDQDGDNQGNGGGDVTIEDIIRRIAGEMDEASFQEKLPDIVNAVENLVDLKLKDYQPAAGAGGDADLIGVVVKLEIRKLDVIQHKDGIFHKQFDKLVKVIASGQHAYLPGPPGTGKSHAAEQAATVLGWNFASLSLGPTTTESRLWGGMTAHGEFFEPPFVKLARHAMDNPDSGSVYCLDELDNGNAGVIATLNSAMANGWFTAPNGDVISMGNNFVIIGAANTFGTGPTAEFAGRNKLDAATLDRFVYLPWDTDLGVETALTKQILETATAKAWLEVWRTCRKNARDNGLKVFVTMRGCLNGAKLIAQGFAPDEALEMVLLNKLPEDQKRKVWS